MHINRKHTKYDENVTSFQCQNCGKEFRNAGEFKEHMIWRSYQQLKFKGYECDSWGSKKQTIEMHIRRIHSETIACGMCDFEGKDIETLDSHTFHCEMYQCNDIDCETTFLQLGDLRSHIQK